MNCPICNKEVSPEWNVCPQCGYKPTKCSNSKCISGWLPPEAIFCPHCGAPTTNQKKELRKITLIGEQGWYPFGCEFQLWIDGVFFCTIPYRETIVIELEKKKTLLQFKYEGYNRIYGSFNIGSEFNGILQLHRNRLTANIEISIM